MSSLVTTFSKFYYGLIIDTQNQFMDFKEGAGPELTATLDVGEYTFNDILVEVKRALEDAGAFTYTVTGNRATRQITIASATGTFSLLVGSGSHSGSSIYSLIGFTGSDRTSAMTYSGNGTSGSEYRPQFKLQSYIDQNDWQQAADASINKTASGRVEVVSFGVEKFFTFNIQFATDIDQGCNTVILNNPTGLEDLRNFMRYAITRSPLEFMPDKDLPNTFYKIILETTPDSSTGVGYKLHELYDKNLPGYFETGILKWRLVEDDQ